MQPQLPSFQSFLASARIGSPTTSTTASPLLGYSNACSPSFLHKRKLPSQAYEQYSDYGYVQRHQPSASRMCQLASFSAKEYETALQLSRQQAQAAVAVSPCSSSARSNESEESDCTSSFSDMEQQARHPRQAAAASTSSSLPHAVAMRRTKKKYLKEAQRCEIVRRVRNGEKQAHLAKEFCVSRAAVCYLLKHQEEILNRASPSTGSCDGMSSRCA